MGYTESQARSFIAYIAPIIKAEAVARGYKICSTAIAQAVIEGAAGTSDLARIYHNHFGMKCGSSWKGASVNMKTKEEYTIGRLTTIKDNFRAYSTDKIGVEGYYDFISTKRYSNLKTAQTPLQYAQFLKADGFATSSTYVNTLVKTIDKYGLEEWDIIDIQSIHEKFKIGNWYSCKCNMNIRNEPSTRNSESILFVLPAGSRILCHSSIISDDRKQVWVQLPPDPKNNRIIQWVCAYDGVKTYLEE